MSKDDELVEDILAETEIGWIELSHAMALVRRVEDRTLDVHGLLRRAGPVVVRMVREGRLVPGEIGESPGTFEAWPVPADAAADRIERELEPIYRRPEPIFPAEICLFTTPDDPAIVRRDS